MNSVKKLVKDNWRITLPRVKSKSKRKIPYFAELVRNFLLISKEIYKFDYVVFKGTKVTNKALKLKSSRRIQYFGLLSEGSVFSVEFNDLYFNIPLEKTLFIMEGTGNQKEIPGDPEIHYEYGKSRVLKGYLECLFLLNHSLKPDELKEGYGKCDKPTKDKLLLKMRQEITKYARKYLNYTNKYVMSKEKMLEICKTLGYDLTNF